MADDINNLVLEHLRAMRSDIAGLRSDMEDVKHRLSSLEQQVAGLRADFAHYSARTDRLEERIARIERRLELRDTE